MEPNDKDDRHSDRRQDGSDGPVPPHDRPWRHPAEVGEWNRDLTRIAATPPPLSRRLTAVIAGASIAFSTAVLVISIPRLGNSTSSDDDLTTVGGLRGATTSVVGDRATTGNAPLAALPAGHFAADSPAVAQIIVASSDDLGGRRSAVISVDDRGPLDANVVHVDELLGVALLEVESAAPGGEAPIAGASSSPASGDIVLVEGPSGGGAIRGRIGISTTRVDGLVPLDIDAKITGVRRVYGSDGRLLGVAVRHHHATWLVTSDRLSRLLDVAGVAGTSR